MLIVNDRITLHVIITAIEFYIEKASIDDQLQREVMAMAANMLPGLREELEEMRKKRNKRKLNPKN